MNKKIISVVLLVIVVVALSLKRCSSIADRQKNVVHPSGSKHYPLNKKAVLKYSKHARCRMDCRMVDESEVKEMLQTGTINYSKSYLSGDDCNKKYAVEGVSHDEQHLRIIFAPCGQTITVVTVIDLDTDWTCHCE